MINLVGAHSALGRSSHELPGCFAPISSQVNLTQKWERNNPSSPSWNLILLLSHANLLRFSSIFLDAFELEQELPCFADPSVQKNFAQYFLLLRKGALTVAPLTLRRQARNWRPVCRRMPWTPLQCCTLPSPPARNTQKILMYAYWLLTLVWSEILTRRDKQKALH